MDKLSFRFNRNQKEDENISYGGLALSDAGLDALVTYIFLVDREGGVHDEAGGKTEAAA